MTFRGILGGLGKTLKWGFISLALIYGLLLAINAVDEEPSQELKAILVLPQIKADPANGFLALVGIHAPVNEDIFNYGTQWVDAYNAAADSASIEKANARFPYSGRLEFRGDEKQLCKPSKTPCLSQAKERAGIWRKLAADNEMLLARQHRLTEFSHFEENYFLPGLNSPFPPFSNPTRLLALDLIALDAAEDRMDMALTALEARISFDRRALLGSRLMITGLTTIAWLRQDYALLAEILTTRSTALASQKTRLDRMTEPLEIGQIRTIAGRLFEAESRWLLHLEPHDLPELISIMPIEGYWNTMRPESLPNMLARPFFKLRATQNLSARYFTALQARIRDFSPEKSDAMTAPLRLNQQREDDATIYSWRFLYNPLGKLSMRDMPENEKYILRLSDLIGITRLAHLQAEVVTSGESEANIPARIAANKALYDPYTGKPMGWDAGKRQLYFDLHGFVPEGNSKRIQVGI